MLHACVAKVSQVGSVEGTVAVSFHDDAGRIVGVDWERRDTAGGPVFCFASSPGAAAVREAHFRIIVRSGDQVLTDHVHRSTFGRS